MRRLSGIVIVVVAALGGYLAAHFSRGRDSKPSVSFLTPVRLTEEDELLFDHIFTVQIVDTPKGGFFRRYLGTLLGDSDIKGARAYSLDCEVGYQGADMARIKALQALAVAAVTCDPRAIQRLAELKLEDLPNPKIIGVDVLASYAFGEVSVVEDENLLLGFRVRCEEELEAHPEIAMDAKNFLWTLYGLPARAWAQACGIRGWSGGRNSRGKRGVGLDGGMGPNSLDGGKGRPVASLGSDAGPKGTPSMVDAASAR